LLAELVENEADLGKLGPDALAQGAPGDRIPRRWPCERRWAPLASTHALTT